MKKYLILPALLLVFCSGVAVADNIAMTQVIFQEVEPGLDPYTTRVLMNKRYVRFDEGEDAGDFVLFDRVRGEIHNFNHEDQSELIMQRSAPVDLDITMSFSVQRETMQNAPRVGEMVAVEHRFFAEGQLCKTSVNFKGLLPDVTRALIQYQYVLMQQSRKTFAAIPDAIKTPCYLANNYLHQSADLKDGFPVLGLDYQGHEKRLLDFSEVTKPSKLFDRPEGYRTYFPAS